MAMDVTRRGFLKFLGAGAMVASTGQALALVTTATDAGRSGYFPFPAREVLEWGAYRGDYLYRVDILFDVPGVGEEQHWCSAELSEDAMLSLDRETFDRWYRKLISRALSGAINEKGGINVRAAPISADYHLPMPEHLRA